MTKGFLHSIETLGMLDGPGIRTVFFLQGCPLRCAYCHNPDSQAVGVGREVEPEEILAIARRYKAYYGKDGGVTFSGGEPTLQGEFLVETIRLLKEEGISVALDTSGAGDPRYYSELFRLVDLIILDVKQFNEAAYRKLTERSMSKWQGFVDSLLASDFQGKVWIRHVMVPGFTDNEVAMRNLIRTIEPLRTWVERIEILPYHMMGVEKYKAAGREYKLDGVEAMDKEKASEWEALARELFAEGAKQTGVA